LPNAKVWSLRALVSEARHETLVMSESDIRLQPDALEAIVSELEQSGVALVTCPYRAVPGRSFWARLEALGLNTEFCSGLLTARLLNGMDFAIGCTIAGRRQDLQAIGGLEHLQHYLAEDFIMGNLMRQRGLHVVLSQTVIAHSIGGHSFPGSWRHRLRWARSTRRSRPLGYVGELFTRTYAVCLGLVLIAPRFWPLGLFGAGLRFDRGLVHWSAYAA
jgi:ceramide glucosyltransferase